MDQNKRRTLKLMAGIGTASVGATSASAIAATAVSGSASATSSATDESPLANDSCGHLKIQIITGRSVPEDTVIFVNDTSNDILVSEFLPGLVTQNNQMIDLNSLLANGDIIVKPGYPVASKAARWEVLSLDSGDSYLWCDTAVSTLPNSETGIININAAIVNGRAMLTAEQEELAFS